MAKTQIPKVLIVDDEPSIVVPLEFLMQQNGYETQVCHNGEEALRFVSSFKPDLILLDIMIPLVDGFEVCQRLRNNPETKDLIIVLVSAMGRDVNVAEGLALGANAYITKPFSNPEIVRKVNEFLRPSK